MVNSTFLTIDPKLLEDAARALAMKWNRRWQERLASMQRHCPSSARICRWT
jgi:hypothetical protein